MSKIVLCFLSCLALNACGLDATTPETGENWVGDPDPGGEYLTTSSFFDEQCEDGSSRTTTVGPAMRLEVQPESPDRFMLDMRAIRQSDGTSIVEAVWGSVHIAQDGRFDTGFGNRVERFAGRFEREGDLTRAMVQLEIIIVRANDVQCNQIYDFSRQ